MDMILNLHQTVTIETGKGLPHTKITNAQSLRRDSRVAAGNGKWSSSLQEEIQYIGDDFTGAGFSKGTIEQVMGQTIQNADKLGVSYERIGLR